MKNISLSFIFLLLIFCSSNAQKIEDIRINRYVDFAATIGESQGSLSGSYVHNWKLWKKENGKQVLVYDGAVISVQRPNYMAPARLARTNTTPFLIFFAGQRKESQDTLTVQRPSTNSVNLAVNLGYNFSQKWSGGFNIDLIGFTFGRKSPAILTSNGETQTEPSARPASFNLLLTGDHDLGSLNSEFFLRYQINSLWSIRAIYQFLFIEYVTPTVKQVAPDGTVVGRFRNKANTFGLGVSYHFKTIHYL